MPERRQILGAIGEGLSAAGGALMQRHMQERQQRELLTRQMLDDFTTKVNEGKLDPMQARETLKLQGLELPEDYFVNLTPNPEPRRQALMSSIDKASSYETVPSAVSLEQQFPRRRNISMMPPNDRGFDEQEGVEMMKLHEAAAQKRDSFSTKRTYYSPELATTVEDNVPTRTLQDLPPVQTAPTPAEEGRNKATSTAEQLRAELGQGVPGMKGQAFQQEQLAGPLSGPVTAAKAAQEAAVTRARERAQFEEQIRALGVPNEIVSRANSLQQDYENASKEFFIKQSAFNDMVGLSKNVANGAGDLTPAAGIGLVFRLMKLYDPTSTVREGEQAQAANATNVPNWLLTMYNQLVIGKGSLPRQQVDDFMKQGATLYSRAYQTQKTDIDPVFEQRATQQQVPTNWVVRPLSFSAHESANQIMGYVDPSLVTPEVQRPARVP